MPKFGTAGPDAAVIERVPKTDTKGLSGTQSASISTQSLHDAEKATLCGLGGD